MVRTAIIKFKFGAVFLQFIIVALFFGCESPKKSNKETVVNKTRSLAELQLAFVNTRYQAYFHYNMATFKNLHTEETVGRTYGKDPADMWEPTGLDCQQWAQVCKDARMQGGWLTTKHHGGFCLWDSKYTDYDVASSNVKTDVVKHFVDAFREAGLKVGLYYSILDYHHGVENGSTTRSEVDFIKNQIRELLTNYGPIDYINFDGWATWPTVPDFDDVPYGEIYRLVKSIQPECLIINHTYESNLAHAEVPFADAAGRAYPYHPEYMRVTAASDFLQISWWWDDNNNMGVRKDVPYILSQLDSYNAHNSVYILNISPNSSGSIDADVTKRLKEVAAVWERPADIVDIPANWGHMYDVTENLAFLKPCAQSSTHPFIRDKRAYPRAEIAVDGVTEGDWLMEQTSGTESEANPWWMVDLQQAYDIEEITIFNATDSSKTNLNDFSVYVLDKEGNQIWEKNSKEIPDPSVTIKTNGIKGQFVKIQLQNTGYLRLAEVIVKGKK